MSSTSTVPVDPSATASVSPSPLNGGAQSSPLLFFVALGFGIVFTNLWIIVGVKYCFRYNARNRMRRDGSGEPIDLGAVPRQHRRRREKKLMTMDEVNDRFPVTKYKSWVSGRAEQGLPTEGGVSQDSAASIKEVEAVAVVAHLVEKPVGEAPGISEAPAPEPLAESKTIAGAAKDEEEEEDEDQAIQTAVATEMMASPGDSCAICIDSLEGDDDVRGLACGHAFHAACVDPWLTGRRACCPLCKADYYVPKPRAEGEGAAELEPAPPPPALLALVHPGHRYPYGIGAGFRRGRRPAWPVWPRRAPTSTPSPGTVHPSPRGSPWTDRFPRMPAMARWGRGRNGNDGGGANAPTPAQLEAAAR